jgi:preprotein translocase subunit YajC
MLYALTLLLAQVAEKAKENGQDAPGGLEGLLRNPLPLLLILVAMFIFMVFLPQQRRERKQRDALMSSLKKNDEVITSAGIIGVVANIKEEAGEVVLKVDENTRIRVLKSSIIKIVTKDSKEGA